MVSVSIVTYGDGVMGVSVGNGGIGVLVGGIGVLVGVGVGVVDGDFGSVGVPVGVEMLS